MLAMNMQDAWFKVFLHLLECTSQGADEVVTKNVNMPSVEAALCLQNVAWEMYIWCATQLI